jgi:hypothetical protein
MVMNLLDRIFDPALTPNGYAFHLRGNDRAQLGARPGH